MKVSLLLALRLGLGFVFVYASVPKIMDPVSFAIAINNYQMLSHKFVYPVAVFLPFLELFIGLSLISGIMIGGGIILALISLIVFELALVINLIRGIHIDCGCFSTDNIHVSTLTMLWYIFRDLCLIVWASIISKKVVFERQPKKPQIHE